MERRQIEAAKQIVTVLGGMKGAAMKVGQVLCFMDVGLVPEEYREEFQAKLAKLRDAAPTVSFEQMKAVIEADLEAPISEVFSEFDEEPIAAASIGQVYRAPAGRDGRDVAVKVQYPGINDAVRADMKNLGMLLRLAKRITPQLDVKAVGDEIRERIVEELDYELEASNQRTMARLYRDHPFIVIPDVVTSLSRERVIVTEFVVGDGFEALRREPDEERDRIGEIVFRFYYGSMFRHRRFSGDPHPGNMMRLADGRIAFLDFGLFKSVTEEVRDARARLPASGDRGRRAGAAPVAERVRVHPRPGQARPGRADGYVKDGIFWYTEDRELKLDPRAGLQGRDRDLGPPLEALPGDAPPGDRSRAPLRPPPRAAHPRRPRPARDEANWHRIAREWIYGDEPVTELGRQETDYLASVA